MSPKRNAPWRQLGTAVSTTVLSTLACDISTASRDIAFQNERNTQFRGVALDKSAWAKPGYHKPFVERFDRFMQGSLYSQAKKVTADNSRRKALRSDLHGLWNPL